MSLVSIECNIWPWYFTGQGNHENQNQRLGVSNNFEVGNRATCICKDMENLKCTKYIFFFQTIKLPTIHVYPRFHMCAIFRSERDWLCVAIKKRTLLNRFATVCSTGYASLVTFWNSADTWSRAPGKQFGVLDKWRDPRRGQLCGRTGFRYGHSVAKMEPNLNRISRDWPTISGSKLAPFMACCLVPSKHW